MFLADKEATVTGFPICFFIYVKNIIQHHCFPLWAYVFYLLYIIHYSKNGFHRAAIGVHGVKMVKDPCFGESRVSPVLFSRRGWGAVGRGCWPGYSYGLQDNQDQGKWRE